MATTPDEQLRKYAAPRQWEHYVAYCEHGSYGAAAEALGVDRRGLTRAVKEMLRKAAQQGYAPAHDLTHEVPDGLRLKGTSIRYNGDGDVEQYWSKTALAGSDPEAAQHVPDPKKIDKVSTLYDQQGNVTQQWVSEKADAAKREEAWRILADELKAALPRIEPTAGPDYGESDLLACYPVGDHHLGMLAWKKETGGESYDMEISEKLLQNATGYLMSATPSCEYALIAFLGDFMHYDSFEAVTPTSRNLLDADGRYPKMVRAAIRAMRYMIAGALDHHRKVHVIVEIGNHDLSSAIFLMEALACIYEHEPRVSIDTSPAHYHYYRFGKTLIGTHHGHGSKLPNLPQIMAADRARDWGDTSHRYWWTGHIHTRTSHDFVGCSVESFRVLAPVDAWAANKGYRAIRDMKALLLHKEHGEVARHTVNPQMFGSKA